MYCEDFVNKISGLDYYGITIITPNMASKLRKELTDYNKNLTESNDQSTHTQELNILVDFLEKAVNNKYYIIHFGI